MTSKVWDEIKYLFPNYGYNHLSMPRHVLLRTSVTCVSNATLLINFRLPLFHISPAIAGLGEGSVVIARAIYETYIKNRYLEHFQWNLTHYNDVIMGTMASQITSLTIVYSTVYSGADHRRHQRFASLAFVREIHRGPVNSSRKMPVTRKMFPFDDVIIPTNPTPAILCH